MSSTFPPVWDIQFIPDVSIPVADDTGRVVGHVRYKGLASTPSEGFDGLLAAFLAVPERTHHIAEYLEHEPDEADDVLWEAYPQLREKGFGVYNESLHPRGSNGKFIPKAAIARAARDPRELKLLQAAVTDPEERKKLHAAVQEVQGRVGKRPNGTILPETVGRAVPGRQSVEDTAAKIHALRAEVGTGNPSADHLRRLAAMLAWHSVDELRQLKHHLGVQVSGDARKEGVVGDLAHRAMTWRQEQMEKVKADRARRAAAAQEREEWNKPAQPGPASVGGSEFERRMAGVDPRESGQVNVPAKEKPPSVDDRDLAARADAGAKLDRMRDWHADRPESVAAEDATRRAEGRLRNAGGGEFGEPGKAEPVAKPIGGKTAPARLSEPAIGGYSVGESAAIGGGVRRIPAYDRDKNEIGHIEYAVDGNKITVGDVKVLEKHRRQGVATKLYEKVLADHPDAKLTSKMQSEDGEKFRRSFDAKHADRLHSGSEEAPQKMATIVGRNNPDLPDETRAHVGGATVAEQEAVHRYTIGAFGGLNTALRTGKFRDQPYDAVDENLRRVMDRTPPMSKPVQVHRAINVPTGDMADFERRMNEAKATGKPLENMGYVSTATNPSDRFFGNVEYHINATHGIDVGPLSSSRQREMLLDSRSKYRVTGVSKRGNQLVVEMDQVPHTRTDENRASAVDHPASTDYRSRLAALKPGRSADIDGHTVTRGEHDPDVVTVETPGAGRRVDTLDGAAKHLERLGGVKAGEGQGSPAFDLPGDNSRRQLGEQVQSQKDKDRQRKLDQLKRMDDAMRADGIHPDVKATEPAAKPANRLSVESDDGPEPTYHGRNLFDAGDEIHEGPHHQAVNDLLTAAGRRFPETQIGPRAKMANSHDEAGELDDHLNRLAGIGEGDNDHLFHNTVSSHEGTARALDDGDFDDEHADEAIQHYREGISSESRNEPGYGLKDLHRGLVENGHADHATWMEKKHEKLNQAFEDDIRRRHEERQAPKKAALAEKLKNPGALTEEEYDEHFQHQPWTDPKTGFNQWKTRDAAAKAARDNLPADHEAHTVSNGGHYVVMARKVQDSQPGYDLSGMKEEVLNSLHGEDGGRAISELRDELSSRKHDPANPLAHPVHRAVKELADEGMVTVGSGSNPTVRLVGKVDESVEPQPKPVVQEPESVAPAKPAETETAPARSGPTVYDPPTGTVAHELGFKRTTPRTGTPEREQIESAYEKANKEHDVAWQKSRELANKVDEARYGTRVHQKAKVEQEAADKERYAKSDEREKARQLARQAKLEDMAESDKPEHALPALMELNHPGLPKTGPDSGYDRLKAIVAGEAKRQGVGDDIHDSVVTDAASKLTGWDQGKPLEDVVRWSHQKARTDSDKRKAEEEMDGLNLTGVQKHLRSDLKYANTPEDVAKYVGQARAHHAENEKTRLAAETEQQKKDAEFAASPRGKAQQVIDSHTGWVKSDGSSARPYSLDSMVKAAETSRLPLAGLINRGYLTDHKLVTKLPEKVKAKLSANKTVQEQANHEKLDAAEGVVSKTIDESVKQSSREPAKVVAEMPSDDGEAFHLLQDDEGGRVKVDGGYLATMQKMYPGVTAHVSGANRANGMRGDKVVFRDKNGEVVGMAMGMGEPDSGKFPKHWQTPIDVSGLPDRPGDLGERFERAVPDDQVMFGKEETKNGLKKFNVNNYHDDPEKRAFVTVSETPGNKATYRIFEHGKKDPMAAGLSKKQAKELARHILAHAHGQDENGLVFKPKDGDTTVPADGGSPKVGGGEMVNADEQQSADRAGAVGPESDDVRRQVESEGKVAGWVSPTAALVDTGLPGLRLVDTKRRSHIPGEPGPYVSPGGFYGDDAMEKAKRSHDTYHAENPTDHASAVSATNTTAGDKSADGATSHPILDKAAEQHDDRNPSVFKLSDRERFELATHLDKTSDPGISDAALRGENIIPRLNKAIGDRKRQMQEDKTRKMKDGPQTDPLHIDHAAAKQHFEQQYADTKFKPGKFTWQSRETDDSGKPLPGGEISGQQTGQLVVHRVSDEQPNLGFTISHAPSGVGLGGSFRTMREAKLAASILGDRGDWNYHHSGQFDSGTSDHIRAVAKAFKTGKFGDLKRHMDEQEKSAPSTDRASAVLPADLPPHVRAGLADHPGHHVIDSDGRTHAAYSPTGEKVAEGPHAELSGTLSKLLADKKNKVAVLDRPGREEEVRSMDDAAKHEQFLRDVMEGKIDKFEHHQLGKAIGGIEDVAMGGNLSINPDRRAGDALRAVAKRLGVPDADKGEWRKVRTKIREHIMDKVADRSRKAREYGQSDDTDGGDTGSPVPAGGPKTGGGGGAGEPDKPKGERPKGGDISGGMGMTGGDWMAGGFAGKSDVPVNVKTGDAAVAQNRADNTPGGMAKSSDEPKAGKKLPAGWVYHNTKSADLPKIASEGLGGGSFTHKPGFDFGGDAWIAVRHSDLRNPTEHQYGNAVAIEPQWGRGSGYDDEHVVPAHRVMVVDKMGRVIRPLADHESGVGVSDNEQSQNRAGAVDEGGETGKADGSTVPAEEVFKHFAKLHGSYDDGERDAILKHSKWRLEHVPVAQIPLERDDVLDPDHAEEQYVHLDTTPPPIVMVGDHIIDGKHRTWAAKVRGDKTIPAYVPATEGEKSPTGNRDRAVKSRKKGFGGVRVVDGHHAKRDVPTHTVVSEKRFAPERFKSVLGWAKQLGGSYINSRLANEYGVASGFQFLDRGNAEQFAESLREEMAVVGE